MAAPIERRETYTEKKLEAKLRKIERILSSKEHLKISKQPTQILCVQNGGLGNGVSQAELLTLFGAYGSVEDIVMIPRKQFSFVSFADAADASRAFLEFNGHLLRKGNDPSQDVVLYLLFVVEAPSTSMLSLERPPGLHVVEDFLTVNEEDALLKFINMDDRENSKDAGVMKHRQVKHFGFEFLYGVNDVDVTNPLPDGIPPICHEILHKVRSLGFINHFPDQLTVNQYKPGQGIPPHVDTVDAFEDGIVSLSLGSQVVMDFRHPDGRHLAVPLPRRSLLVMTGASRYIWSHGITPRKSDIVAASSGGGGLTLQNRGVRTSFTFRKVVWNREAKNAGGREENVDGTKSLPQTDLEARLLEQQHVHEVYDNIADHFSGTRYKPWPKVAEFLSELPPFSLLADVGCGNGKYLGINKNTFEIGSDYSRNLASICRSRGFETCVTDVTNLALRSDMLDVVLCIAVIHHMSTQVASSTQMVSIMRLSVHPPNLLRFIESVISCSHLHIHQERRMKALSEVVRVLRSGGTALIYVWAMEQDHDNTPSKYINGSPRIKPGTEKEENCAEPQTRKCSGEAVENSCASQNEQISTQRNEGCGLENVHKLKLEQSDSDTSSKDETSTAQTINVRRKPVDVREDSLDNHKEAESANETNVCTIDRQQPASAVSKKLRVHVNRTQFKEQDMLVPWQLKCKLASESQVEESLKSGDKSSSVFHRFYHMFRQGELESLCKKVPRCVVKKSYYDQGNWCVVVEKL